MKSLLTALVLISCCALDAQDLSTIYRKVSPAIVVIFTREQTLVSEGLTTKTVTAEGLGSGFMITDSTLMTAAHVVQVAEQLLVQFEDGEVIPATVVSAYKSQDVALVQLTWPRKNQVTVSLGNSDNLQIGQRIFIVGAPYGLSQSLSSGYVSGFKKGDDHNPFAPMSFIQTDAAINQGNSGGPMFNVNGEVMGIVSNILSNSGGFEGIGFAATSNVATKLLLEKRVLWTGADLVPLTGKLAAIFNLPQSAGLLAQRVVFLSPMGILGLKGGDTQAEVGGEKLILGGDIILSFNDIKFDLEEETLDRIVEFAVNTGPNDPLRLTVLRQGRVITLERK